MKNVLQSFNGLLGVFGRILLSATFVAALVGHTTPGIKRLSQSIFLNGMLSSQWAIITTATLLLLGVVSVVLGYRARIGASLLLAFLLLATYSFHGFTFWKVVIAQAQPDQRLYLMMSLALMGAMLFIIANGAGQMSLDGERR